MLVTIIIVVLLNFPIFLSVNALYTNELNKLTFNFRIYRFIRIFNGFIKPTENGIEIFYNKKMKKILYRNLLGIRKSIKPFYDYHFINVKSKVEIGNVNSLITSSSIGFIILYINSYVCDFFKYKKPHLKIDSTVNVYEGESLLNIHLDTKIVLNLLMIVISLIKIISGKILNAKKFSKQN